MVKILAHRPTDKSAVAKVVLLTQKCIIAYNKHNCTQKGKATHAVTMKKKAKLVKNRRVSLPPPPPQPKTKTEKLNKNASRYVKI